MTAAEFNGLPFWAQVGIINQGLVIRDIAEVECSGGPPPEPYRLDIRMKMAPQKINVEVVIPPETD